MKPEICAPSKTSTSWTCYSSSQLRTLKKRYNKHHSNKIKAKRPRHIWNALKERLQHCTQESCFATSLDAYHVKVAAFAPTRPMSWEKKITEWLSSDDITPVMRQYERVHKDFRYIGPSPADFYYRVNGTCVWEDLCRFRIEKSIKDGHVKVGIIFNLDEHNGPGTHWVAVYLDLVKKIMYYFDSAGDPIEEEPHILTLYEKLKKQDSAMKLEQNHPVEHQYGESECGMYAMFFIVTMLETNNFKLFTNKNKVFKDHLMVRMRSEVYNKNHTVKKTKKRKSRRALQ